MRLQINPSQIRDTSPVGVLDKAFQFGSFFPIRRSLFRVRKQTLHRAKNPIRKNPLHYCLNHTRIKSCVLITISCDVKPKQEWTQCRIFIHQLPVNH